MIKKLLCLLDLHDYKRWCTTKEPLRGHTYIETWLLRCTNCMKTKKVTYTKNAKGQEELEDIHIGNVEHLIKSRYKKSYTSEFKGLVK